jgi:crossover junction endodeoxyribonuclease RuvC
MMVVGLDLALIRTGVAVVNIGQGPTTCTCFHFDSTPVRGHERLQKIQTAVWEETEQADLVVMEGLAYAAPDSRRALAGAWWLVQHMLWAEGKPVAVVPPATLKQYATGRGNAKKPEVMAAVNSEAFPYFRTRDDNAADAAVLAAMGARAKGQPVDRVPVAQQAALLKSEWPWATGDGLIKGRRTK